MKALKIVGSILLVLVLVVGTYVGIITKGFRKWTNLKTEKQKVVNFYNNGKTGIPSDDYKALADENEKLAKTVDDLSEDNSKLLSDKTTLTNQVDNLTDEKNTLLEKNSELQEKLDVQSEFKVENRKVGYEVALYSQNSWLNTYSAWDFGQESVKSLTELYSYFFNNFSQADSMGLNYVCTYDLAFFNEKENRYDVVHSFVNPLESVGISSDDVDFSFVTNYSDKITEERKTMIENNTDDGVLFYVMPTLDVSKNENGRYTAIFSLNILSAYVNSGV